MAGRGLSPGEAGGGVARGGGGSVAGGEEGLAAVCEAPLPIWIGGNGSPPAALHLAPVKLRRSQAEPRNGAGQEASGRRMQEDQESSAKGKEVWWREAMQEVERRVVEVPRRRYHTV